MKVIMIGSENVNVHGLTRGELKALRTEGANLETVMEIKDQDERDAAMDKILAIAAPGVDPDAITPGQATDIILAVADATYMPKEAQKNLPAPPANGSPDGNTTAKRAGKRKG